MQTHWVQIMVSWMPKTPNHDWDTAKQDKVAIEEEKENSP